MRGLRLLLTVLVGITLSPYTASADYALGLVAYDRGDIATEQCNFGALAEDGYLAAQYSLAMLYLKNDPAE